MRSVERSDREIARSYHALRSASDQEAAKVVADRADRYRCCRHCPDVRQKARPPVPRDEPNKAVEPKPQTYYV